MRMTDHNNNAVFCSNAAELYTLAKAIASFFFPVKKEKKEEDEQVEEENKEKGKEITTTMKSS